MPTVLKAGLVLFASVAVVGCVSPTHERSPAAGYVPDARSAVKIAEAAWMPIYGERQLRAERPFHAVLKGNVWEVYGTLAQPQTAGYVAVGGTVEASIDRRTGKVLRITHGE